MSDNLSRKVRSILLNLANNSEIYMCKYIFGATSTESYIYVLIYTHHADAQQIRDVRKNGLFGHKIE